MNQSPRVSIWDGATPLALGIVSYIPFAILFGVVNGAVAYVIVLSAFGFSGMLITRHYGLAGLCAVSGFAAALYGQEVVHYFVGY